MGSRCTSAAQMVLNLQAKMLLVSMNRRVKASTRTSHGLKTSNSSSRAKLHSMRRSKRSVRALSSNVLRMPNGRAPPRQATLSRVKQLHRPLVAMALRHMLVDQHRTAEPVIESLLVSGKLIQSKAPYCNAVRGLSLLRGQPGQPANLQPTRTRRDGWKLLRRRGLRSGTLACGWGQPCARPTRLQTRRPPAARVPARAATSGARIGMAIGAVQSRMARASPCPAKSENLICAGSLPLPSTWELLKGCPPWSGLLNDRGQSGMPVPSMFKCSAALCMSSAASSCVNFALHGQLLRYAQGFQAFAGIA